MSLVQLSDISSIQTAWLLGNMGKLNRQIVRRDVANASIPVVCASLMEKCDTIGIRYSSSILYGVTLIYKTKISIVFNETQTFMTMLKKREAIPLGTLDDPMIRPVSKKSRLLSDDAEFDIRALREISFIPSDEKPAIKRYRKCLQEADDRLFPTITPQVYANDSFEYGVDFDQTVELDLELSFDQAEGHRNEFGELLDFNLGDAALQETHQDEGTWTRLFGEPFNNSTTNVTTSVEEPAKIKSHRLKIDTKCEYTDSDTHLFCGRFLTELTPKSDFVLEDNPRYKAFIQSMVSRGGVPRDLFGSLMHSVELSRSIARLENTEHEISRRAPAPEYDRDEFDLDIDDESRTGLRNVFDLSFGLNDTTEDYSSREETHYEPVSEMQLAKFHEYLLQEANKKEDRMLNFADIIPSQQSVYRELAASSFMGILALATKGDLAIDAKPCPHSLLSGKEIDIILKSV